MVMKRNNTSSRLRAVDFFCGAGGMSVGLSSAGVEIVAGIDIDADCRETYEANLKGAKFIQADVATLRPDELACRLRLIQHDDNLILVACSPCQFYSQIRTDKTKSKQSAGLLQDFLRFVEHMRPGYVLIENVPRLAKETILSEFKSSLRQMGYAVFGKVLNASDYGVPQNRQRFVLLASRVKEDLRSQSRPSVRNQRYGTLSACQTAFHRYPQATETSRDSNTPRLPCPRTIFCELQ